MTQSSNHMWLANRSGDDLYEYAPPLVAVELRSLDDMELVAGLMVHGGPVILASATTARSWRGSAAAGRVLAPV